MKENPNNIHVTLFSGYMISAIMYMTTVQILLNIIADATIILIFFGAPIVYTMLLCFTRKRRKGVTFFAILVLRLLSMVPLLLVISRYETNIYDLLFLYQEFATFIIFPLILDYLIIIYWGQTLENSSRSWANLKTILLISGSYVVTTFVIMYAKMYM